MAVAWTDGEFDGLKGKVIRNWIIKSISPFAGQRRTEMKNIYNNAMKSAYEFARAGNLDFSELAERLNDIGETKIKYDALELCYKVTGADEIPDPSEIEILGQIGNGLKIDHKEVETIRDIIELPLHIRKVQVLKRY